MAKAEKVTTTKNELSYKYSSHDALMYRLGKEIVIPVYDGDRLICECHDVADALEIVSAVNTLRNKRLVN